MQGNENDQARPPAVKKLMSTTLGEFHRNLERLVPGLAIEAGQRRFEIPHSGGQITITVRPAETAVLGGLVKLERQDVTLAFANLTRGKAGDFVAAFNRVFQRGGG